MIRILEPVWLLALIPVAALAAVYVWAQFRRDRTAVRFANTPVLQKLVTGSPGWRRHIPASLLIVALTVLATGLAKPAIDKQEEQERATIILAMDVSLSMNATDVDPTRIDAAKDAALSFVEDLPEQYNVGLVQFAGFASIVVPPTQDRAQLARSINGLNLAEATATGEAVFSSLQAVQQAPDDGQNTLAPAHVLLLSDGFLTTGRNLEQAASAAEQAGVPVSTVAFGTDLGTVEINDQMVGVPVDREALEGLAEATQGKSYEAASAEELREVYESMGSSLGEKTVPEDISRWFIAVAMLLLFTAGGLSLWWSSRLT
ncbi:VWA domain-containing protein [Haloglycomyces albus]|uniref:VWA domain-containing protein n=1 Tax=Haloglycomyces albus TaxID=526067 RepID=UPI00046D53F3|nr:VWA domain-containing protein [Haloglycomyces albus]